MSGNEKKIFRGIEIERRINGIGKCNGLEQSKVRKNPRKKIKRRKAEMKTTKREK